MELLSNGLEKILILVISSLLNIIDSEEADSPKVMKAKKAKAASSAPRFSRTSTWKIKEKHFFKQSRISSATYHPASSMLSIGFATGTFGIYMLPEFSCLHTLGISQAKITAVAVDPLGEWIAFGCKSLGQILVWEWKSESYILKQQGHHYDINALSYSLDSQFIATGAQV